MIERYQERHGRLQQSLVADNTYGNGELLQWLDDRGITPYIRVKESPMPKSDLYGMEKFTYAAYSNAASAVCSSSFTTIFPGFSPLPKACFPTLMFNSVPCTCSAMPKPISAKLMPSRFNSAGALSRLLGISRSPSSSFEELCDRFAKTYPSFIAELRKKRQHYLAFLNYPEFMRRSFSTTNLVEAINGQLEIMRRNSGGYFHSEDVLKLKLGLAISSLEEGRWRSPGHSIYTVLHQLNAMFQSRFEGAA